VVPDPSGSGTTVVLRVSQAPYQAGSVPDRRSRLGVADQAPFSWSATKDAIQESGAFQLMVISLVAHEPMSSM
jgi:hypothetical protein